MSKARDLANAGTALTTVSATELGYLDGVTSAVQTQINAQIPKSTVTTKGDILVATGSGTIVRQGVGTDGQVLVADSAQADGVNWATPSAGGMTLISTTNIATQTSVTISSISQSYKDLRIIIRNYKPATDGTGLRMRLNADATANRHTGTRSTYTTHVNFGTVTFGDTGLDIIQNADNTVVTGSLCTIDIPDYTNTVTWKSANFLNYWNDGTTTTTLDVIWGAGWYNQTSAISSLQFYHPDGTNMTSGTILIYGVN